MHTKIYVISGAWVLKKEPFLLFKVILLKNNSKFKQFVSTLFKTVLI